MMRLVRNYQVLSYVSSEEVSLLPAGGREELGAAGFGGYVGFTMEVVISRRVLACIVYLLYVCYSRRTSHT